MDRFRVAAVLVVAVVVRVVYVLALHPHISKFSDAGNFHVLGDLIRHNRGYIVASQWSIKHVRVPTAEFGPVHPTFLAVADLIGLRTIRQQQLFMGIVGSFTPVLTSLLAWRLTRRQGIAFAAGLVAAVDPMLFGADGSLMTETVYTLLATLLIVLLLRSGRDEGPKGTRIATKTAVGAGIALGLAVLTRGDAVLLVPFVVVPLLWRRWRELATVGVVAVLVITPWVVRNEARFHQFVLSTNIGSLISGSNCPEAYHGSDLGGWNFSCAYRIELVGDEAVDANNLRAKGIDYAKAHAGRLPVVVAARVGRGWGVFRPFDIADQEADFQGRVRVTQKAGVVITWFLAPLALAGVWLMRRRRLLVTPVLGPILMVTVLYAISYGLTRFGAVAQPGVVIGAVCAVAFTVEQRAAARHDSVDASQGLRP
jgi:hypothetical protein